MRIGGDKIMIYHSVRESISEGVKSKQTKAWDESQTSKLFKHSVIPYLLYRVAEWNM